MAKADTIYTTFEALIETTNEELRSICVSLRAIIKDLHPDYHEVVWKKQNIASYGVGPKKMTEHYVYLALFKKHVNLGFYYGAVLPDEQGLLLGAGKSMRHIKIRSLEQTKATEIHKLIREAVVERQKALG